MWKAMNEAAKAGFVQDATARKNDYAAAMASYKARKQAEE